MSETYTCHICDYEQTVYKDAEKESDLGICNGCWFSFLTGSDRKAIAQRMGERYD